MRTLIYLRVSTDGQERAGTSLDTQGRESIEYAQAKGETVTQVIRDVASGASLDRPGLEQVRRAMRDGSCDVVLAHAVDRLSRNQNHIGVLLDEAEEAGVRLDFVTEEFEQTLVGQFILAARAFVAATEREKIVERTVRGKKERARSGRLPQATGKGCYGYTYVPETGRRDLNPEQAPIVARIFEEFVAGKSCNRIANDLNADDIPTFTGRRWHPITARRVLDNETYTGRTVFGKTRVEMTRHPGTRRRSRRVVERDESEHIEIPDASPPIISRELFNKARELRGQRTRKAPSRNYPLGGRIRCLRCGAGMVGCGSNNGRYTYYRCNRVYLSKKDERCKSRQVRTDALEPEVRDKLGELLANPAMVIEMAESLRLDAGNGRRLDEIERDLGKVRDRERKLVDLYTDGAMEKTLLDEKSKALADHRGALERERMRLIADAEPGCDPDTVRERMPEALTFIREWVRRAGGDELQLLLEALRVSIKATRDEAEIRVELPLIEGVEGRNYSTIEQTWA